MDLDVACLWSPGYVKNRPGIPSVFRRNPVVGRHISRKITTPLADIQSGPPLAVWIGIMVGIRFYSSQASGKGGLDCVNLPGLPGIQAAIRCSQQQSPYSTVGILFSFNRFYGLGNSGETALMDIHWGSAGAAIAINACHIVTPRESITSM